MRILARRLSSAGLEGRPGLSCGDLVLLNRTAPYSSCSPSEVRESLQLLSSAALSNGCRPSLRCSLLLSVQPAGTRRRTAAAASAPVRFFCSVGLPPPPPTRKTVTKHISPSERAHTRRYSAARGVSGRARNRSRSEWRFPCPAALRTCQTNERERAAFFTTGLNFCRAFQTIYARSC